MNSVVNTMKRGRGGRSSFNGITATVFNGSGFLAQHIISRLGKIGTQMVIAYRGARYDDEKIKTAGDLGHIFFAKYNLKDEKSLHEAMRYSNVVINTIGKDNETSNFSFEEVHVEGPRRMARIAREAGVKKFIHFSAMNAQPNPTPMCLRKPSEFLRSKYFGELAVREEFPDAIIFRPSEMAGDMDNFLWHFNSMQRSTWMRSISLWDYYDGVEKQPVWVSDVVSGVLKAVESDAWRGKTIQAVGPYRYDFCDLIEYIRAWGGRGQKYDDGDIYNLRWDFLMRTYITMVQAISKKPFLSWERVERDCTTDVIDPKLPTLAQMGVQMTPLELPIKKLCNSMPRFHRVEIPYTSRMQIDLPKRLNLSI